MLIYNYITPVMFTDSTGYFILGVMIASIAISLAFEVYEDFSEDGDFDFGWRYLGAAVSGFFSGLVGTTGYMFLYSFIGSTLDYFICNEQNLGTLGKDLIIMAFSSAIGVTIGKLLKLGLSKLKAKKLLNLGNNNLANKILGKMGLSINIGSNAAQNGLGQIIYESGKYFLGEILENIGANVSGYFAEDGLLIVFD